MTEFEIAGTFERGTRERWLALVAKVLKGEDFEKRLVSRTADGLRIAPLYTRADSLPATGNAAPGLAPYTRGTSLRTQPAGWDVRQRHAEPDPLLANAAILDDLAGGVGSITLQIAAPGSVGLPYLREAVEQALDGVMLDACPVYLDAGEYTVDVAGSLTALWRQQGRAESAWRGGFNADPLGTLARTGALYHRLPRSLDIAARLAADAADQPGVTALLANGHIYHAAGATEAQELACVLATIVAYLRASEAIGLAPDRALPKIAVTLAVDPDQFLGTAKLRAARRLVWQLADTCGAGEAAARVPITAETSLRMMARRDPWVNMLRTTMACTAAALGGADAITVLPFTWALGRPDAFARRIARNTQLVLMEESGLARVIDPAGGSWAIESLTASLARQAWQVFQGIEARGGMGRAITSGFVQDEIGNQADALARKVATGEAPLTGTSAFPRLGDDEVPFEPWPSDVLSADLKGATATPLHVQRLAEPFERLRDAADAFASVHDHPPRVFLASLGPLASHAARSTWARNFLAAGGIEAIGDDGHATAEDAARAFTASGTPVACICGSDDAYARQAAATAQALKAAGARLILLAGRPKDVETALKSAGLDDFLHVGCDMPAALANLHAALGVAGKT